MSIKTFRQIPNRDVRVVSPKKLSFDGVVHNKVWDKYLSVLGSADKIDQAAFIECMKKLVHDPSLKQNLEGPLPLFFNAVDANDDKMISGEEFQQFLEILGLDKSLSPESFKAIDENGDGQISLDELVTAGSQFFLEEADESKPTKMFWGPLL